MAEYIGCRGCSSPSCKGCNVYILETMLKNGKFDCLMNGNRSVNPWADVAPVVRCKDCKHYIKSMMLCKREGGLDTPDKMDFCSYGERIET